MKALDIQPGKKYLYRTYPNLKLADLHKVKVLSVATLGDGAKVVKFRHSIITEYVEMDEFMKNVVVEESK